MFKKQFDRLDARYPRFKAFREWARRRRRRLTFAFVVIMHVLGAWSSVRAVMSTRTPQGAVAWAISLNTFPYVAVPAYWVFGESTFDGYELLRRREMLSGSDVGKAAMRFLREEKLLVEPATDVERRRVRLLENLAKLPMTRHNDADLLIDGEATFEAIFESIAAAKDYVLVQFYIMRPDDLGQQLKQSLLSRAAAGVRVYVLFDALGSHGLGDEYIQELRDGGVHVAGFKTTSGWGNRYRVNFRNHRKIVVLIDDDTATVGTANFDNRSMRLNFEVTMLFVDRGFAEEVETMLEADFDKSRLVSASEFTDGSLPFRLSVKTSRLLAPIQ